jgi:hypothetical protein
MSATADTTITEDTRYLRFRGWLEGVAADGGRTGTIHFEEVRAHAGTDAAHIYGGLLATLTSWCEQRSIPYQGVPVGTIKRLARKASR